MNKDEHKPGENERSVLSIIQDIKNDVLDPTTLSPEERQRCVDFLLREGYTQEQIAQIFKTTDRTIRRDVAKLRKDNLLNASGDLAKEIIGDMFRKATTHHAYLVRLARSSEAGAIERGQLEYLAWRVLKEMIEKMQGLGYLPSKPQAIVGDIFHHIQESSEKSFDEIRKAISDVEAVAKETEGETPQLTLEIAQLKTRVEKAQLEAEVNKLSETQSKKEKDHEPENK